MNDFYDALLYFFPNLLFYHEIRYSFLPVLLKIEKQMFDAIGISIFVGFDFHNVDTLRLKGGRELLSLLFSKQLILCIYSIYITGHDGYSYLLRKMEYAFMTAKITK